MPSSRSVFAVYLLGLGTWFVPLGIQMVLFPWLVAVVLHMDAFAVGGGPFGYRRDRELSPHEQFFMVLLSPRTPSEIKRKLRGWEARVLDGEITPQETQDLRFMYQSFVVG